MNLDAIASGGESSVINSFISVMEPEEDGGVLDIHECQHLEVVAPGNSCTEDTDLVEPAGEEPGASSSKRAQKTALVTNPKVQRGVRKVVAKRTCSSRSAMNPPGPSWKPKLVKYRTESLPLDLPKQVHRIYKTYCSVPISKAEGKDWE